MIMPPNNHFAADCPSWVFSEGVSPVKVVKIESDGAGKVKTKSKLGLYSDLSTMD